MMIAAIKTALALLIEDLGGVAAAGSVVKRVNSIVSDWQNHRRPMLPSLEQVMALEAVAPHPWVTEAMARAAGYRIAPVNAEGGAVQDIVASVGEVVTASAGVMRLVGEALQDGRVDDGERARLAEELAATRDQCDAVLAVLAGEAP